MTARDRMAPTLSVRLRPVSRWSLDPGAAPRPTSKSASDQGMIYVLPRKSNRFTNCRNRWLVAISCLSLTIFKRNHHHINCTDNCECVPPRRRGGRCIVAGAACVAQDRVTSSSLVRRHNLCESIHRSIATHSCPYYCFNPLAALLPRQVGWNRRSGSCDGPAGNRVPMSVAEFSGFQRGTVDNIARQLSVQGLPTGIYRRFFESRFSAVTANMEQVVGQAQR